MTLLFTILSDHTEKSFVLSELIWRGIQDRIRTISVMLSGHLRSFNDKT